MTKNEKRIIAVFCVILLVLAGFILIQYYNRLSDYYTVSENKETVADQIPITGYEFVTACGELNSNEHSDGITLRRTFTHTIFTPDGQKLTDITTTVTGTISNDSSVISHISTSLSDEQQNGLTVSEHHYGETATVVLYMNQISICHFQYRLLPDGSIDIL